MTDAWDGKPPGDAAMRSGPHALEHCAIWGGAMWWSAKAGYWIPPGSSATFTPQQIVRCYPGVRYLGPALLPAEVAAAVAEARREAFNTASDAAHDAIHDAIYEITECGRVKQAVDAAIRAAASEDEA